VPSDIANALLMLKTEVEDKKRTILMLEKALVSKVLFC
jgi:hypothetical protein